MRILFVTSRPPWPSRRGDQARVAGWVDGLTDRHELAVVCQRPPGFPRPSFPEAVRGRAVPLSRGRIIRSLTGRLRLPRQVAWHYQPELARVVEQEIERFRPQVVVVVLSRMGWLLPSIQGVPVVLDLVDSLALNMRRRASRQAWLGTFWRWEARRIGAWELELTARVARVSVVSDRDRQAVCQGDEALAARLDVIPFGIPVLTEVPARRNTEPVVLLSGNLGYFPTRDGALWLAREVWPAVRHALPEARWLLAGSRIPDAVRRLERLPGVRVVTDPENLSEIRQRATVAVAPMRAGSGTPIKILESMADGLPVVSTPEAAAGLEGLAGGEVAIGSDPAAFASALVELLRDPQAARVQAAAAHAWVRARHELIRVTGWFEDLLAVATSGPPPRRC